MNSPSPSNLHDITDNGTTLQVSRTMHVVLSSDWSDLEDRTSYIKSMEVQLLSNMLKLMRPMIAAYLPILNGAQCHAEILRSIKVMWRIEHIETYFTNG